LEEVLLRVFEGFWGDFGCLTACSAWFRREEVLQSAGNIQTALDSCFLYWLTVGFSCLKGLGLQQCGLQVWCWFVSTVLDPVEVERQLDLSSVAARLRVVVVVGERRLTGCGLTLVVCPVVGTVESRFLGLSGPAVWAHSTRWFTGCERDEGVRRIKVATDLVVAFTLPLFWVVVCMCAACHMLGSHADVNSGKEGLLRGSFGRFGVLAWFSACSRREDVVRSGGNAGRISRFCHGSVDTPIDGVDTGSESLKLFHENRVKCVDTVLGSVDTRSSLQKTQLPDWDSVST
ncbi:hypothetical protein Taro_047913, partial [Colocasia esculenta]|nr:hypothetical protein [Colocasia esculenta]